MPPDAGYSGTPLVKKLGIKDGHRAAVLNAPMDFLDDLELPASVDLTEKLPDEPCDVILFFTKDRMELEQSIVSLRRHLDPAGGLWIAWPKKASKVLTDLTEDVIRAIALRSGLVDNKVCAIDATWSGLRLMFRLKDRPQAGSQRKT
jgi:hypothetical protein